MTITKIKFFTLLSFSLLLGFICTFVYMKANPRIPLSDLLLYSISEKVFLLQSFKELENEPATRVVVKSLIIDLNMLDSELQAYKYVDLDCGSVVILSNATLFVDFKDLDDIFLKSITDNSERVQQCLS